MLQGSFHHTPPVGPMPFLPPTLSLEQDGATEAKKGEAGSTDYLGLDVEDWNNAKIESLLRPVEKTCLSNPGMWMLSELLRDDLKNIGRKMSPSRPYLLPPPLKLGIVRLGKFDSQNPLPLQLGIFQEKSHNFCSLLKLHVPIYCQN